MDHPVVTRNLETRFLRHLLRRHLVLLLGLHGLGPHHARPDAVAEALRPKVPSVAGPAEGSLVKFGELKIGFEPHFGTFISKSAENLVKLDEIWLKSQLESGKLV